jgi:ribonuclease T2
MIPDLTQDTGIDYSYKSRLFNLLTGSLAFTSNLFSNSNPNSRQPTLTPLTTRLETEITLDNGLTCPIDIPLSCSNDTLVEDLCCFEYPGGVILLTQFWDYNPSVGPLDEFTLHGLWPDNCDGSFEQFCNSSLEIHNPDEIVKFHDTELYEDMNHMWKDYKGQDEQFWSHEYNKHGTCMTTIQPQCYGEDKYVDRIDVYDFFKAAVSLHKTLPTFKFLSDAGIVPSFTQTYNKQQILSALTENFGGYEPFVKCDRNNAINEIWYFHHLQGNVKHGKFNAMDSLNTFRCPNEGIKFIPKTPPRAPHPRPTKTLQPGPRPTGRDSISGVVKLTNEPGCLIKNGKWYVSGTCATYRLIKSLDDDNDDEGKVLLKSNGGFCGLDDDDTFVCSQRVVSPTRFDYDEESGIISTGKENGELWSASRTPSGRTQVDIRNIVGGNVEFKLHFEKKW